MNEDPRWLQRFANYKKALQHLNMAVNLSGSRDLSDLEKQGVIKAFEFTYELAWNVVKDFYESKGEINIQGGIFTQISNPDMIEYIDRAVKIIYQLSD